ncbi:MAG: hypothetical protein K0Q72_5359 [Armatimonadetes bacterium]|nr:hypothetical protein [Armatimonadota bacterium]
MAPDPDTKETAWCAGFPQSGQRQLEYPELQEVTRQATRFTRQAWGSLAAGPGLFALLLVALGISALSGRVPGWLSMLLVLDFLYTPLGVMLGRDWLLRAAALRKDAAEGWVRQYAGHLNPADPPDEIRARLLRRQFLDSDPRPQQWFEVLPHSCRVWTANGRRAATWISAPPNLVAVVPDYAATAAEWVEPATHAGGEGMHVNMRELSPTEIQELDRHRRRLVLRPLVPALLFTLWATMPLAMGTAGDYPFGLFVVGGFAVWSWLSFSRVVALAGRVKRDLEGGRVVIVRRETPGAEALSAAEEFLPESGLPWSAGERPASWRMSAGR